MTNYKDKQVGSAFYNAEELIEQIQQMIDQLIDLKLRSKEIEATAAYIKQLEDLNATIPSDLRRRKDSLSVELKQIEETNNILSYLKEELMTLHNRIYAFSPTQERKSREKVKEDNYSNRLLEIRTKKGLSQMQLHSMTGIAQATISNIESGNRNASPLTKQKLADALGVTVKEIFQ